MNRAKLLFIATSLLIIATSCNNKNKPTDYNTYSLTILINEGGYQTPMDMIGFNEDALKLEGKSMSNSNETPLQGEFRGLTMDAMGYGYPLLSNYDRYAQVDMTRFKVVENNLLTDLAEPVAMTVAGYNLYILNNGKSNGSGNDTLSYVSVYSSIYQFQLIGKVYVSKGGTALYVDDDYIYIAGKEGVEAYSHMTNSKDYVAKTPTKPMQFLITGDKNLAVSCPGYGICVFDTNTKTITNSIEVPIGPHGDMAHGKDANDIFTYTDTEVYLSNIGSSSTQKIYEGSSITGVGRSPNTQYTYIADENGTQQHVFNDKREEIASFSTPEGSYTYIFSKRIVDTQ